MMTAVNRQEANSRLFQILSQAIEMPANVVSLHLHMVLDKEPTVELVYRPQLKANDWSVVKRTFRLEPIDKENDNAPAHP